MRLKDRVVIITGGGRGIGAATARAIVEEGGKVVIGDMLATEGEATAATIRAAGGDARYFVKTDVSREADCGRLVAAAVERHGKVDVLICCAGILRGATLQAEALDEATFESVLDVNLKGTFLTVKSALPHLRTATQPVVLLLASRASARRSPAPRWPTAPARGASMASP